MAVEPTGAPKRVTLEHVAARAKVSRALASIVIRNAPGATEVNRRRVMEAARELGYRPDARARSLAGQSSRLIGVMFGVGAGNFQYDLLEGLYDVAESQRYGLLLSATTERRAEQRALESLHDFRFDALIMLGPATDNPQMAGQMPVVVVGWHVDDPSVDVVRTSDDHGMALAVDHLVGLGHKRIAHIDGGPGVISRSRSDAYRKAMHERKLGSHVRVVNGGTTQLDGQLAAQNLLAQRRRPPTAIIAYNDDTAVSVMGVLAQAGINVPDDISVIGWDDSIMAKLALVPLTSVAQQPHEMARLAVERIIARNNADEAVDREVILEPELTIRVSTTTARP